MRRTSLHVWASLLVAALATGCATSVELQPAPQTAPGDQAQRIYRALLRRDGRAPRRGADTLSGFAEAPHQMVRELEALAASSGDQQRGARVKLAEAMASTGLYSKVRFATRSLHIVALFRLIGKDEAKAAGPGWNYLPVGVYEIWGERSGRKVCEPREYEVLQKEVLIVLTDAGGHGP